MGGKEGSESTVYGIQGDAYALAGNEDWEVSNFLCWWKKTCSIDFLDGCGPSSYGMKTDVYIRLTVWSSTDRLYCPLPVMQVIRVLSSAIAALLCTN